MKAAMVTNTFVIAIALSAMAAATAIAGPLTDRIAAGKPIRLGFANEVPAAYLGKSGEPEGFVNIMTLDVLKKMGYDKIEPVQTEWGGLVPGLQAGRFDIITGGMFILASRCENVAFAEPIYKAGEAFLVPAGNPKHLRNYDDLLKSGVTGAGYANIQHAKAAGVDAAKIMEVPGPPEILAAVQAGRADAGAGTPILVGELAAGSRGKLEVTDPAAMPKDSFNWGGLAFSKEDQEFIAAFNAALKEYIGSEEMMKAVAKYGYTKDWLPGDENNTKWICANR
ncbi:ectoine/hydroxyectoine ABC transporter substrate-binding protein EhuB [Mesorhizobium kowhaii]|uniref:ectoine/hydroxyectoine ABC transporter substrate-binding protein EhuB n=1 Tax=Mesorhizobium kowhaii TaxID=1300272 RepID=UPI0035E5C348